VKLVLDISADQGPDLNVEAMLTAGVDAVYLEATRGNDGPNQCFHRQLAALRRAGIPCGAYLFCYPLNDAPGHVNRDPRGQALLFYNDSGGLGSEPGELPPMLDAEWPYPQDWTTWTVTRASIAAWLDACAQDVDGLFQRPAGIYTDVGGFWQPLGGAVINPAFGGRKLWMAQYRDVLTHTTLTTADPPPPPPPWTDLTLWQWTDKFEIDGRLYDASVFPGDDVAWSAFLNR